jgi:ABC-2 type transport system ATP-binding protein
MIIEIENLNKSYQNHQALKNISLSIEKGKIFGLLGPNGAGKTSLIRILTRITQADSGVVRFNKELLSEKHMYSMGYLPEERGLYKKMTVKDQLLYFAELKGLSNAIAKEKLKYWIDQFDIKTWLGKKVEELSKGMQQKIQFIATVVHEPDLIILDEPFSGFDPVNAQMLVEQILRLKENGATILFSTHRMDSVELLCDNIALINHSEKVLDGEVNEIRRRFRTNHFEVKYQGAPILEESLFKIISHEEKQGIHKTILQLEGPHKNNEIIQNLLSKNIQLISFGESLPSMEEIFIHAVQQKSGESFNHA